MTEVLTELEYIAMWVAGLERDYTDINEMLYQRTRLNGLLITMRTELVQTGNQMVSNKYDHKTAFAEAFMEHRSKGGTITASERLAGIDTLDKKENYELSKTYYFDMHKVVDQFNELSHALSQRIASLRDDKKMNM